MHDILFYNKRLTMGGLERKFVDILNVFRDSREKIRVIIEEYPVGDNNLSKYIPERYRLEFLTSADFMSRKERSRTNRRKNIFHRLIYNYYLSSQKKVTLNNLNDLMETTDHDVILDYSNDFAYQASASPKISWIHNSVLHNVKRSKLRQFKQRINNSYRTICICDEMIKQLTTLFPDLAGKLQRIYNPFDLHKIRRLSKDVSDLSQDDRKLLDKKFILTVGRLDERQKDVASLIRAFAIISPKIDEDLYIVGEGIDREKLAGLALSLGLNKRVVFLGLRDNPYAWMKHASLFALSSKFEGFPTVLVEAIVLNKVIVSTDCVTGPKEILKNGELGRLVDVGNLKQMADGMRQVLSDKTIRASYLGKIKNARDYINQYDAQNFRKQVESLISEVRRKGR